MSSKPMVLVAFLVFCAEGVGVTFDMSSSGAGVAPEVNGLVPEIAAGQVSKQKVHRLKCIHPCLQG
jgi:hypothetical protein